MEGYPANPLVPPGYINSFTPLFFPQPQITHVLATPSFVYVSPEGSDDPANVGSITSPFATISAALFYVTTISDIFPVPLSSPVCIFVAPGIYAGGFIVPDNVYLIGPSNSPVPVVITSSIFASTTTSSATIGLMNLTLQALEVAGAVYNVNVEVTNCKIQTETIFSALSIAPLSALISVNVRLAECEIRATDETNANLISATASELVTLTLDRCELVSEAEEGNMIDMIGNLTIRNSSITNIAAGTTLAPLILFASGATLTPVLNLEGSVLRYTDLQTDAAGNKLAIKFDADAQPITATMTNCTIDIKLGGGQTNIVKNVGASNVTLSQSANSCLSDGKDIDTTNINLPVMAFLQNSPTGGGGGGAVYQATYYRSAQQNLTSGATDLTFDEEAAWNNDNGYITHTGGTAAFTVVQAGLYQLEFNATIIANGSTWTNLLKQISVDITRAPTPEFVTIAQNGSMPSNTNYGQSLCSTFNLEAGDVINCRVSNTYATGTPYAQGVTNTIDLNTWFTWRYVSASGGGGGGVNSVTAGTGIAVTGSGDITIDNTGVTAITDGTASSTGIITMAGGTGVEVINGAPAGTFTFNNTGVTSLITIGGTLTGGVTLSAGDGIAFITSPPPGANEINIANAGVLTIVPGTNITVTGDTPQNPTINYVATPPAVQAAATTPLTAANVNTLYILTSGTTQNFTTVGLGVGDSGKVWYVKNAFSSDINIQANGVAIAGVTDVLHTKRTDTNTPAQVLYWNGTGLTMY